MFNRSTLLGLLVTVAAIAMLVGGCSTLPPLVPVPSNYTGGSERAALINNVPTVILDGPGAWQYRITLQKYPDGFALGFPVAQGGGFAWSNLAATMNHCWGLLYVTGSSVTFSPDIDKQCNSDEVTGEIPIRQFYKKSDPDEPNMFEISYALFAPLYIKNNSKEYRLSDTNLTNGRFFAWISLAFHDFDHAVSHFYAVTHNLAFPLSAQQQTTLQANESTGDAEVTQRNYRHALTDYLAAIQVLPVRYAPRDVDTRLRTKIINTVLQLNPPPAIPDDAVRYEQFGKAAAEAAHLYAAVDNFQEAIHSAPWWADGYYNLAVAQEKANMYGAAADALQWYLRSAPHAPDAASVKLKIYNLQYKQSQQQSGS